MTVGRFGSSPNLPIELSLPVRMVVERDRTPNRSGEIGTLRKHCDVPLREGRGDSHDSDPIKKATRRRIFQSESEGTDLAEGFVEGCGGGAGEVERTDVFPHGEFEDAAGELGEQSWG